MLKVNDVSLRCARRSEKSLLWKAIYIDKEWKRFDAPYYPVAYQSKFKFGRNLFKRLITGESALVIDYKGEAVGYLTFYWEDRLFRWLEIGITIFYSKNWNKKIGRIALSLWISHLFHTTHVPRIGLSTWSGNPQMMKCAESLGMKLEGNFRKVRFFNNQYYNSIHYGILREEWERLQKAKLTPVL